jgi:hypothetical protein
MKIPKPSTEKMMILLAILLLGAWIGLKLFAPKVENSTVIAEKTTIDTVKTVVDVVISDKATKRRPIKPKKVKAKDPELDPEPEKYDSIREYAGTNAFQYGKFDWKVRTGGILESYEFNPQFIIPTITVTKEKTITQTRTIIQKGVFAGGGMNSQGTFHAGATYLGNKFLIEYNFTPSGLQPIPAPIHQVGFKYKIF